MKNNKACGGDLIINEFLKYSASKLLPIFFSLFNIVFDSGCIPETWSEGSIVPIYKNKGDPANADNYRGITVLSCFGKLFTCILNNRLNSYLENYNVLCEEQAGFRKQYSTTDHIFNLNCFIDLYLRCNKALYCAFVDYKKHLTQLIGMHYGINCYNNVLMVKCLKLFTVYMKMLNHVYV